MKVSIIHAERRCAQQLALDVITPGDKVLPTLKLLPTERHNLVLARGALLCIVASALLKQHGPAPLVIELEAEEGETLHADSLRVFVVEPPPVYYTEAALDEGKLVRLDVPLTRAGDRQQFGIASIEISPTRDALLLAIANRAQLLPAHWARPTGCICREFIGDALKIEEGCPVHVAAAPQ